MAVKEKILVVDDEPSIRKYLQTLLEVDGFDVQTVGSGKEALGKISAGERPDFIILDVLMPEMSGLDTLKELMQLDRSLNVIMLSCSNEVGTVVEAIRIGAHDYLTKPFEKTELDAAMLKSRQKRELTQENKALRDYCDQVTEDLSFLAASPQMVRIRQQILQIAPVDVPVFICGESGVGKEVVARMIHLRSSRRNQAFVKVNCAALPGELLESELFGFEQGAFTGADEHALAGETAARLTGSSIFATWRAAFDRHGRTSAGGDQRGSSRSDEVGALPRGLILPAERVVHQRSPVA
jgi:DNA-binding NtrC family response regulator